MQTDAPERPEDARLAAIKAGDKLTVERSETDKPRSEG